VLLAFIFEIAGAYNAYGRVSNARFSLLSGLVHLT